MTFTVRPYDASRPRDLDAMTVLVQEAWNPERRPDTNLHIGDLYWRLRDAYYEDALWLWEDAQGDLAGFCEYQYHQAEAALEVQVHPRWADGDLSKSILDWAVAQASGGSKEGIEQPPRSLTTFAAGTDARFRALLDASGFQRQDIYNNSHARHLGNGPLELSPLPDGYTARHLAGQEEIERRVQGHREGWQTTMMTVEKYQRLMQTPGYRNELDIVVVAPDGSFAATCNCWLDQRNRVGLFEPVSTAPPHRRLGLGRALIHKGLEQLRSLGAEWAWVCSTSGNPAATGLYESCHLAVVRRDFAHRQP